MSADRAYTTADATLFSSTTTTLLEVPLEAESPIFLHDLGKDKL